MRITATTIAAAVTAAVLLVVMMPPSGAAGPRAVGVASGVQRPDVVLLVLDEFPGDSLLGTGGRIDPVRYPNFAALASGATWFRNAYSVYDSTTKAVPLILDGMRPVKGSAADRATTRSHSSPRSPGTDTGP